MLVFTSGEQDVERGFSGWAGQRYSGPRISPLRQLRRLNFTPFVKKRAFCYESLAEWKTITTACYDYWQANLRPLIASDVALTTAEDEHAEKMLVNWRALGYGRLVFASEFDSQSDLQARELSATLRSRSALYVKWAESTPLEELRDIFDGTKIKLNKGKGAPYWNPGSDRGSGLLLAMLGRKVRSLPDLREMLSSDSSGVKMLMTMFMRVQAARKPTVRKRPVGSYLFADGEMMAVKVRTVKAPPFVENNVVAPIFELFKNAAIGIWPKRHLTDPRKAAAISEPWKYLIATDLSNCDDRIGLQLLTELREIVMIPFLKALLRRGVIEQWLYDYSLAYDELVVDRDILAPARSLDEEACTLRMRGGVKSGERGTTWKDLELVGARTEAIQQWLAAQGISVEFMSWGDDVLVMTNDDRARALWPDQTVATSLWSEKIDVDASYLGRRMPTGYTYFMRMVARRINREPSEEPLSTLGAALSVAAAYDTLGGHPLKSHFLPILRACIPRLRSAVDIASQASMLDIMHLYARSIDTMEPREMERALALDDDGGIDNEIESGGIGGRPIYSKRLEEMVNAEISEEAIRAYAERFTTEDIRRRLRRKTG